MIKNNFIWYLVKIYFNEALFDGKYKNERKVAEKTTGKPMKWIKLFVYFSSKPTILLAT